MFCLELHSSIKMVLGMILLILHLLVITTFIILFFVSIISRKTAMLLPMLYMLDRVNGKL